MGTTRSGHQHSILVVEDDSDVREALVAMIELQSYDVRAVDTGQEALALLVAAGYRPCLVLLDIMLPDIDGWAVQRTIQSHAQLAALSIVILSGTLAVVEAHARGDSRMLAKPVEPDELRGAIAQLAYCSPAP